MRKISINNKFEKRKSGYIPKKWKIITLGDDNYANLIMGQSPPSSTYNDKGMGLPFLQGKAEFGEIYPRPIFSCSNPIKIAEKNDILISVRAPVGDVNISPSRVCIGRGLAAIKYKPDKIDYLFLFYYLKYESKKFKNISSGSTFKAIRKDDLDKFELLLPPLPEQSKIVEILSSADKAIEEVDESIIKTQKIKKGLIQKLLTKGIGHKEFIETELGRIPRTWRIAKITDVGSIVNGFGFPTEYQGMRDGEYIFVKVSDTNLIGNEKYILTTNNTIDNELAGKIGVNIYPTDTVIFPKIGMVIYLRKVRILGKTGTFDNNIMGIIPNKDIINTEFFFYYFLENIDLTKLCGRTTAPSIRKSEVEKLCILLPPLTEQNKIAKIISTVDERIQLLKEKKNKLKRVKKGLMHELLTGRKRVKVEA